MRKGSGGMKKDRKDDVVVQNDERKSDSSFCDNGAYTAAFLHVA